MKRDIYIQLEAWKYSPRRKPLILNGARQVGKTYALKHFGKNSFAKVAYLNFEKDEKLASYFQDSLNPLHLIKILGIHTEVDIEPHNTLIIFDEVQECPRALNSLKYFCEEAQEFHIAAAGSLLGVKTAHEEGFPVGKVNFLHLYPLSFFEFLSATNHEMLRSYLEEHRSSIEPFATPLHEKLIQLLKIYMFIGGMPEAVAEYCTHENFRVVREVQMEILLAYERDFAKHAPVHELMKISTIWRQIPNQLAKENKKFVFAAIRKSARARDYEDAIGWLVDAGLIYKSYQVSTPGFPLSGYADVDVFKVFLVDVGLLGAQSNLSAQAIIDQNSLFTEFKGALTENFVAQELLAAEHRALYYWTSQGTAEVDFLLQSDHEIYPLEVKSGTSQKKKSLLVYGEKYTPPVICRASLMNLKLNGKLINFPLYFISHCTQILEVKSQAL